MKIFLSVCFLVCSMTLSAQVAEIFGGINKNEFYGNEGFSHFSADYTIEKTGYRIGLGMEGIILGPSTMRFTVSYDAYSGALHASDGALGAGHFTDVEIDKSIISIGVFPLNMKVADQLNLNLGCEFSRLINEHIKGTYTQWTLG